MLLTNKLGGVVHCDWSREPARVESQTRSYAECLPMCISPFRFLHSACLPYRCSLARSPFSNSPTLLRHPSPFLYIKPTMDDVTPWFPSFISFSLVTFISELPVPGCPTHRPARLVPLGFFSPPSISENPRFETASPDLADISLGGNLNHPYTPLTSEGIKKNLYADNTRTARLSVGRGDASMNEYIYIYIYSE